MAAIPADATSISTSRAGAERRRRATLERLVPAALLLPSLLFLATAVMQVAEGQADVAGIFYSKSVYPYTVQGAPLDMCFPREGTFAGINTVTLVKNGPERELAVAFIDWMLSPEMQQLLAGQTLTAPTLGDLSFRPEVEKFMAYPESKMDEMGIFSPDWTFINPLRPQLLERYNQVFGA